MKSIQTREHPIYFNSELAPLAEWLATKRYSKILVLADTNTSEHCIPVFRSLLNDFDGFDIIETDAGEENKNIDFCIGIWKTMLDFEADRNSLLINLGGGVITDMGGFIASTYKRGIDFINIPTSLLAQVDASTGGKTGIDMDQVKNMIGTFSLPQAVYIEHRFLSSLPERELRSGFAEMIKHGLIADAAYFEQLRQADYRQLSSEMIYRSVQLKNEVVREDPLEKGRRKILNFGHTIGHAIESYSLQHDKNPLTHGEAIALGMMAETYLSVQPGMLTTDQCEEICNCIRRIYPKYAIPETSFSTLFDFMRSDKKNENGEIRFSLLEKKGHCIFNVAVKEDAILESLHYINRL